MSSPALWPQCCLGNPGYRKEQMNSAVAPTAPALNDAAITSRFRYWQYRTLIATMFGYAAFYFVRKNLSFAMPAMQTDLGITKADLGLFLTLHGLLYGVSRFVNGMWADRANARYFMVAGLLLSVGANVFFGFSSTVLLLGVAWMINGWVQGMGRSEERRVGKECRSGWSANHE